MSTLHDWLEQAWERHDTQAQELAHELLARATALPDDEDGADAVRLARHTMLSHLARPGLLHAFIASLPAGAKLDPARSRAEWALAQVEGRPAEPLPEVVAWGLLGDVVPAELLLGRLDSPRVRLLPLETRATNHPDPAARRAYAATVHNVTHALRLGPREPALDVLMIEMAELERRAWERAGTWMHVERADYHLALCHAVLGHGAEAQRHAAACIAACEAHDAEASERFFAHESAVHAAQAAGDREALVHHRSAMVALLAAVQDTDMHAFCEQTLAATPQ
ncbi:hypothetical protein [Rubrivivax gelatinosus]|uniref:Uncharacterized protein n=1 Tax=Rubrivivax gelatinosus TaxID=28068 RepID=A0ABS1DW60_RUBGE|nr:hypothetical protein [Rubrivivax gelatinosus]MBK1713012.1 hypothetical protein [Rubrivivax gelatinosus]